MDIVHLAPGGKTTYLIEWAGFLEGRVIGAVDIAASDVELQVQQQLASDSYGVELSIEALPAAVKGGRYRAIVRITSQDNALEDVRTLHVWVR